jgi:DNA polymerase-1
MGNKLTGLIDGDTVAFIAAAAAQGVLETEGGFLEPFARRPDGEAIVDNTIHWLKTKLGLTDLKVFLSCPAEENWRLGIDPEYKSNRKASVRPLLLTPLKEYLRRAFGADHLAFLEADDAIGVYATSKELIEGDRIIIGLDKDFRTIPGTHFQFRDLDQHREPNVREITAEEAIRWHYAQALAGDAVDGYAGCPGIGMTRALRIVESPERLVPKEGVITRGARKGEKVIKWHSAGPCSIWEAVVSCYEKEGLSEADALRTARLAKILHATDYDIETKRIRLWVPDKE